MMIKGDIAELRDMIQKANRAGEIWINSLAERKQIEHQGGCHVCGCSLSMAKLRELHAKEPRIWSVHEFLPCPNEPVAFVSRKPRRQSSRDDGRKGTGQRAGHGKAAPFKPDF